MADPTGRTPHPVAAVGGGLAAVVVVLGIWFAVRGSGDDVEVVGSSTTAVTSTEATGGDDGEVDSTDPERDGEATESTTIDDVPLSDLPAGAPDTFVAVTSDTFELVRVDSRSGEVVDALGSWGLVGDGDVPEQVLQTVELAPDGVIVVDDCCEPAYGNTFIVTNGFDPDTTPRLTGYEPEVSPSGAFLARADRGSAVTISDLQGNGLGTFGETDFTGTVTVPLTWVDDSTLVVNDFDPDDEVNRLKILDVSNPDAPSLIAERDEPGRMYSAADVRADGNILVVTRTFGDDASSADDDDVIAEVIDVVTADILADFDLPDDVYEANYDATGRFVVTAGSNGQLDWYGAGQRGTLGTGFISADW